MEPLTFEPIPAERVWGGRKLERIYGRKLPNTAVPYGESWELVDREREQSVVNHGPWAGTTLHELWREHRTEVFGANLEQAAERFPLLIKILDARDDLSVQVHPPAAVAATLGGEPKTEIWYVAAAEPAAKIYAGLKRGVTRDRFEQELIAGTATACLHTLEPQAGEALFLPSGRLHAIGGGLLIHEIQQNSDTTYRVFDWNRPGLDGKPRALHVAESLASIDFNDFEPAIIPGSAALLADCPHFRVERILVPAAATAAHLAEDRCTIFIVVAGALASPGGRTFPPGALVLVPCASPPLHALTESIVLRVTLP